MATLKASNTKMFPLSALHPTEQQDILDGIPAILAVPSSRANAVAIQHRATLQAMLDRKGITLDMPLAFNGKAAYARALLTWTVLELLVDHIRSMPEEAEKPVEKPMANRPLL